jgi:hypothetical protein
MQIWYNFFKKNLQIRKLLNLLVFKLQICSQHRAR